ncbi:Methyltransferase type 11 [Stanieria sp. NIES-3757]|nr:Methyltransferase type 11 [Stanieria sp. NIES-3757]
MNNQWNAELYEDKHSFVWQYGSDLITILSPQSGERILDLGCGTGQLTNQIAQLGAEVMGIDKDALMIEQAKANYPQLSFQVANGTNFSFTESFDAVFSNAALHWMKPPEAVIKCIWQVLKPGGRLIAEFGGKGNVKQIIQAIETVIQEQGYQLKTEFLPWYFPSIAQYATLLEQQGFIVTDASLFERPTELEGEQGLANWLTMFANSLLSTFPSEIQQQIITAVELKLRPILYQNQAWFADYNRIRIVALKPQ